MLGGGGEIAFEMPSSYLKHLPHLIQRQRAQGASSGQFIVQ